MTEYAPYRPNSPVESAFTEALIDVTSEECDLDAFFERVQREQFETHMPVLARYCNYADLLFDQDATHSQQAFIEGAVLGLWVAGKMAAHSDVEQPNLRELLANNAAVPPDHRAIPNTPEAEHHVAIQLNIARSRLENGFGLEAAEQLIRLSDISPEQYEDARSGMIMAVSEASFALEARDSDTSYGFVTESYVDDSIELTPEEQTVWQVLATGLETDRALPEQGGETATETSNILLRYAKNGDNPASQISKLAADYQRTDPMIFDSILYQSSAAEPRDEDYGLIDRHKRAAIHFLDGAVLAMRALEVESKVQGDAVNWRQHDPADFPGLGMAYQAEVGGAYNIGAAIDHRGELFRQASVYYAQIPEEYRDVLLRITSSVGYDSQYKYVFNMGFAFAYGHLSNPVSYGKDKTEPN